MGPQNSKIDVIKTGSYLRQSISRINIHRSKKLNIIAKKKDDIAKHLAAGNEVNAKIWAETLINEEGLIPCYDIVSIMCDQLSGRLKQIAKFGPSKDMNSTFHTLIYAAPRLEVDEMMYIRSQLGNILGKEFVLKSDNDESCVNKVIVQNINLKIPEEGEKILKLVQIAKERNIDYKPSGESYQELMSYIDRKGIDNPFGGPKGGPGGNNPVILQSQQIQYNPQPVIIQPITTYQEQPPPVYIQQPNYNNQQQINGGQAYPSVFIPPTNPQSYNFVPQNNDIPPTNPQSYSFIPQNNDIVMGHPSIQQTPQNNDPSFDKQQQFNYSFDPLASSKSQDKINQDSLNNIVIVQPQVNPSVDDLEARLNNLKKM